MKNDYDAPEDEPYDMQYEPDGLRWMSVVVVMLVMFGFFSLAWYAYRTNVADMSPGEVPVVEADPSPVRIAPEDPGGMRFAHQDKEIYNAILAGEAEQAKGEERLLPAAEEPSQERQVSAKDPEVKTWINDRLHPVRNEEGVELSRDALADEEPAQTEEPAEAKPEEISEAKPAAGAQEEQAQKPDDIVAQAEAFEEDEPVAPVAEKPEKPEVEPIEVASKEEPVQAEPKPEPKKAATPELGKYMVQVAALRSEQEALSTWKRLNGKHNDLLDGKPHKIVRADLGAKGVYYRLRIGGLASRAKASELCAALARRNQGCMPVN